MLKPNSYIMKIFALCLDVFVLLVVHHRNGRRKRSAGAAAAAIGASSATIAARRLLDIFFVVILLVLGSPLTVDSQQVGCSTSFVAVLGYGTASIVEYGIVDGCPGEKPCDYLDACCKVHDECVDKHGMTNVKCHEKFKRCIKKVQKSGKGGFSEECPYDVAVPTMTDLLKHGKNDEIKTKLMWYSLGSPKKKLKRVSVEPGLAMDVAVQLCSEM
ncbi:putative phospholipase A2 homolog 1 [Drosera capensis]